jgi:hypothetical protein
MTYNGRLSAFRRLGIFIREPNLYTKLNSDLQFKFITSANFCKTAVVCSESEV